jgi:23S rRNA (guanine2445-N2)-methyltransferase / 23S rRNA (guanine2069-N7)-methyltransferase
LSEAQAGQVQSKVNIFASDIDPNAVKQARDNAAKAGVGELITFTVADATQLVAPDTQGYLVSNLPYGKRSGEIQRTSELMQEWGSWLKKHYAGWQLSLLNSQEGLLKQLKLIAKKEYALLNGNIPCYLNHYVLDERNCIEKPVLPVATDFVNRLDKNIKQLARWLATQDTNCYRLYDADLPDYNMAIDRYEDYLVVQEYAPPKWIKESKAQQRLQDAVKVLPKVLNIPSERIVVKQRRQQKGANQYAKLDKQNRTLVVFENRAKFRVNLWDYLDTGLFLDHRDTRQIIRTSVKGKKVLNLFCYTGSVSVFAALGGATSITSVDMSNTYLKWAESNFELNRLQGDYHFIQSDVLQWIEQCSQSYDFIFVDPPSFSNSKRMQQSWDVQRDHVSLLTQLADLLNKQGEMLFSTNLRQFKFDQNALGNTFSGMTNISGRILPQDFKRTPKIHQSWLLRKHAL